ncbi:hypothetical protein P153DRAFT_380084 [Dothidotthia symphoricarpi CBS 119687]|uniref:Uncharacterized protein n=1 Tax=Dothidotthia symphoricarpi CBS 119687 TaxID=1392245 RepID=A0A6A5ZWP7_9PLEO|nr:uncharacterized protein P153DRAFT_380084 [Dothidotthia symphoricarpi CBS 119687]KAF2123455.1 hypothetical protein P153DRAFT_380084 [Dothidotthia symphoricarpi CBS 119687]
MRSGSQNYINIDEYRAERRASTPWYWRLVALAASWMILGGYLLLPGLYAKDAQLRFRESVLSVFIVALLTAGYSFTALLCFACRNEVFQAEGVFLPALTSSALGLLSIAYNFSCSRSYTWAMPAITGVVVSTTATLLYSGLLIWQHRRIIHIKAHSRSPENLWSDQTFYTNYVQNMYPTAVTNHTHTRSPPPPPPQHPTEDDRVNQQMALLQMTDSRPSPDANSSTFRIDMPEDRNGDRPENLSERQAWDHWQERGRTAQRPVSAGAASNHSRGLSREERRREIELGHA